MNASPAGAGAGERRAVTGFSATGRYGFDATVDAYRIDIRDRIVLSENLSGGAVTALLAPFSPFGFNGRFIYARASYKW